MANPKLIAIRELRIGDRLVVVELSQNEGRSVAARCVLGTTDTPIIDAPSEADAIATLQDVLEGALLARHHRTTRS